MDYFLNMIMTLRESESVILYNNLFSIDKDEKEKVISFLKKEYQTEKKDHPFIAPEINSEAALWGAEYIYTVAQLVLYRESFENELENILPFEDFIVRPESILSVDLCLRFLPQMIEKLKLIDLEDKLIFLLEGKLKKWHFSGVNYTLETNSLDFNSIIENKCLNQLYVNRVIEYKNTELSNTPACRTLVSASLGIFSDEYWKI